MIGLDTNLLVRILVRDDEAQLARVSRLLERSYEEGRSCLVTLIVLCELEWVLETSYKASRNEIAMAIQGLLVEDLFEVEEHDLVQEALNLYRRGKGDLSDYLLGARGRTLGAITTYTLDGSLRDSEHFTLLQ